MLNDDLGRKFRDDGSRRFFERGAAPRDAVKVLVVDDVIGSRFSLVQAASQPGFVIDACATTEGAERHLVRVDYALVIVDETIGSASGVDWLESLRARHPRTARALVTAEASIDWKREAIERADLAFLLTKPWSAEGLRRTLRELFGAGDAFATWEHVDPSRSSERLDGADAEKSSASAPGNEVLLRGLLAGLNSCETESEVFELLRSELSEPFGTARWLWVDEEFGVATGLAGDWPVEEGLALESLSISDRDSIDRARRGSRVSRVDVSRSGAGDEFVLSACFGLGLRIAGRRALTGLVWTRGEAVGLVAVLRELASGLQLAVQRIREAEARADAARSLARRVSEELRTPVGALTHAVDLLRGEAERAGLSTEWVDRISSESERVVRAVEHLEGEMLATPSRPSGPAS